MYEPDDLETMRLVRGAFDPEGLANPGKLFPTPSSCGESARRIQAPLTGAEPRRDQPLEVF